MLLLKDNFKPGDKIPHDFLNTIARFWNELTVVPSTGVGVIRQSTGHHTTILTGNGAFTPDTNGYLSGPAAGAAEDAGRKTIERNPEEHHHNNELQLHDVDTVGTYRNAIPYFVSVAAGTAFNLVNGVAVPVNPEEARAVGTLAWAVIDGHSDTTPNGTNPIATSLEVVSGTLQVGSFNLAGTCTVPYVGANDDPGDKWLDWRYPVTLAGTPYAEGTMGTVDLLSSEVQPPTGSAFLQVTLPTVRAEVNGAALNLVLGTSQTFQLDYTIYGPIQGTLGTPTNHDDLAWNGSGTFAGAFGANCSDHDQRHFRRGDVGAAQNYCDEIGNVETHGISAVVIDLEGYSLHALDAGAGTMFKALDWQDRQLLGSWTATGGFGITGTLSCAGVVIGGDQIIGTRQTGVGTYAGITGSTYIGIDNAQAGTIYATVSDLNNLEGKVEAIGTYLAALCAALGSHGLISP